MRALIIKRLLYIVPVVAGIVFLVTITIDLIPGDPVQLILGQAATPETTAALRKALGLDRPFHQRYLDYMIGLTRWDLGQSIREGRPVTRAVAEHWPATLRLTLAAISLAVVFGMGTGLLSVMTRGTFFDDAVRLLSILGLCMPVFWVGLIFIYLFGYYLRWLPVGGIGGIEYMIMPAVALALPSIGILSRMTRASLLETFSSDYVRTARAKGVTWHGVLTRHALRNALIPVITVIGLQFGQLMGGAVLTETVFAWPGLGRLTVYAITARDYPMVQGGVLVFALVFTLINLIVDLSYALIDPRLRYA
ncbi:MAG: ABC transporter permease [Armatimonadetes bacterium]|nr:ABC transporter permease [Armatimonadota bacterium]